MTRHIAALKIVHISQLAGKTFKGDPRPRRADGSLIGRWQIDYTPAKQAVSKNVSVRHEPDDKEPFGWFRWQWEQTTNTDCCNMGIADISKCIPDTYFYVERVLDAV